MTLRICPEADEDRTTVWNVNRAAFEAEEEANLVDALRNGGYVEVSLVADVDSEFVGHILFSRFSIVKNAVTVDDLSLTSMAVMPTGRRNRADDRMTATEAATNLNRAYRAIKSCHRVLGLPDGPW